MRRNKDVKPKMVIPPFIQALILEMVKAMLLKLLEQIRDSLSSSSTRCNKMGADGGTGGQEARRALDEVEEAFRYAIESLKDH